MGQDANSPICETSGYVHDVARQRNLFHIYRLGYVGLNLHQTEVMDIDSDW